MNDQTRVLGVAPQQPAEVVPLSDEQIEALRETTFSTGNPFCPVDAKSMRKAVRAAERAHGILAAAQPTTVADNFGSGKASSMEPGRQGEGGAHAASVSRPQLAPLSPDAHMRLVGAYDARSPTNDVAHANELWNRIRESYITTFAAALVAAQPPSPPAPSADLGPCYCPPDACQAPVIMGRRTPCLRSAAPPQPPVPEPSADAVREALAELVWLKDLKDRTEGPVYSGRQGELEEYRRRKPLAWAAASVALAASPKDQP